MNDTATQVSIEKPAQDVLNDLEARLYPEAQDELDGGQEELEVGEEEEVLEDAEELPDDDDSDSDDDDEGSDDDADDDEEATLADFLGIDDDRIVETEDGLMFNAIIDGETKQVPLKDLAASYQLQGHVNNKSMALETERKEFDEVRNKVSTELKSRIEGLSALGDLLEKELVGEYNSIDWDGLRAQDPAQWAALRQEYAERAQKVQDAQKLIGEEGQRMTTEQQQQAQQAFQDHMLKQKNAMVADNPDWADDEKFKSGIGEIRSFLMNTYGYADEEIQVTDHRLVKIFKDAMAYRNGKKAVEKKRVGKKLPKFQKPGINRGNAKSLAKARAVKAKKAAVKSGGGNVKDVANLIVDRM